MINLSSFEQETTKLKQKEKKERSMIENKSKFEEAESNKKLITARIFLSIFLLVFFSLNYSKFDSDTLKNLDDRIRKINDRSKKMSASAKSLIDITNKNKNIDIVSLANMEFRTACSISNGTGTGEEGRVSLDININSLFNDFTVRSIPFYTISSLKLSTLNSEMSKPNHLNIFQSNIDKSDTGNLKFSFNSDFNNHKLKVCFIAEGSSTKGKTS